MKIPLRILLVLSLLFSLRKGWSQWYDNTQFVNPTNLELDTLRIQQTVNKCERTTNIKRVVKILRDSCGNDLECVYGIFTYIATTFEYDLNRAALIRKNEIKRELYQSELMRKKKGVCGDFSKLFKLLADSLGIPSFRVNGYCHTFSFWHPVREQQFNHSWNVVRVDDTWYSLDVTFGVLQVSDSRFSRPHVDYRFLMQDPHLFELIHMPADPDFQLLSHKRSFPEFRKMHSIASLDTTGVNEVLNQRYTLNYLENILKTAENTQVFNRKVKYATMKISVVPMTSVIDRKTKLKEKITEEDIELAKALYSGLIAINEQKHGKKYKRAIRYCQLKLEEVDKLERKLFPSKFK